MKKVSVVMITYNHEKYIEDAIKGVYLQKTDFPIELIIADDCSPDNSDEIIKKLILSPPDNIEVKYTRHEKNLGMMKNFSWALSQSDGEYIALCEGDDYWTDEKKLQKQFDFLENDSETSLVFHGSEIKSEIGALYNKNLYKGLERRHYSEYELLTNWLIPTASVVFRNKNNNKIVERLKNPKYCYGDIIVFLSLLEIGKLFCLPEKMSVYRINDGGVTRSGSSNERYKKIYDHLSAVSKDFNGRYKEHFIPRRVSILYKLASYNLKKFNLQGIKFLAMYYFLKFNKK